MPRCTWLPCLVKKRSGWKEKVSGKDKGTGTSTREKRDKGREGDIERVRREGKGERSNESEREGEKESEMRRDGERQ